MQDILYADLVTKIGMNDLTPGEQYRITDYVTTYYIYEYPGMFPWTIINTNATDSGSVEPLIVTALTDTILSAEGESETYPGDTLFYTIDNIDEGVFASTKGTITRRLDNLNQIDMPYDYRSVQITLGLTNYYSIPADSFNVRIGMTASFDTFTYTKTVPIYIGSLAQNVNIDMINDDNGLQAESLVGVTINRCFRLCNIGLISCNLQSINIVAPQYSVVNIKNFIGGYLMNVGNVNGEDVFPVSNPNLSSDNPKVAIPGGWFINMASTIDTQNTYIGSF